MKDVDWKIVIPLGLLTLAAGAAAGTFLLGPKWVESKEKKKAKKGLKKADSKADQASNKTTKQ